MAEGRAQSRVIDRYLTGLEKSRPRRGRKRTSDSIQKQLAKIEDELSTASPIRSLNLTQQRDRLQAELAALEEKVTIDELEAQFVEVAKPYAERKGIPYKAWREAGVPPEVLQKAGIGK